MEKLVVARNSLVVLVLAQMPGLLNGSAGVWQFPAYGPSPRPLEAPTPRVARAAIPKDLVSGITYCLTSFNPWLTFFEALRLNLGRFTAHYFSHLQNITVAESVLILCDIYAP